MTDVYDVSQFGQPGYCTSQCSFVFAASYAAAAAAAAAAAITFAMAVAAPRPFASRPTPADTPEGIRATCRRDPPRRAGGSRQGCGRVRTTAGAGGDCLFIIQGLLFALTSSEAQLG